MRIVESKSFRQGLCVVGGEVSTRSTLILKKNVRETVLKIGYSDLHLVSTAVPWNSQYHTFHNLPDINIGTRADLGKHKDNKGR